MPKLTVEDLLFLDRGPYNFCVQPGEILCLSGVSGAGKSLLLRAIADLDPQTGNIFLGEKECKEFEPSVWRKKVGYLAAESQWWFNQVGEHFPETESTEVVLTRAGFEKQVLEWDIHRLSTGEKQRLALARLMMNEPEVLLLDEPTASLDAENISRVEDWLRTYAVDNKVPVVWVSHDLIQIGRVANRCFEIKTGGALEEKK